MLVGSASTRPRRRQLVVAAEAAERRGEAEQQPPDDRAGPSALPAGAPARRPGRRPDPGACDLFSTSGCCGPLARWPGAPAASFGAAALQGGQGRGVDQLAYAPSSARPSGPPSTNSALNRRPRLCDDQPIDRCKALPGLTPGARSARQKRRPGRVGARARPDWRSGARSGLLRRAGVWGAFDVRSRARRLYAAHRCAPEFRRPPAGARGAADPLHPDHLDPGADRAGRGDLRLLPLRRAPGGPAAADGRRAGGGHESARARRGPAAGSGCRPADLQDRRRQGPSALQFTPPPEQPQARAARAQGCGAPPRATAARAPPCGLP